MYRMALPGFLSRLAAQVAGLSGHAYSMLPVALSSSHNAQVTSTSLVIHPCTPSNELRLNAHTLHLRFLPGADCCTS